MGNKRFYRVSKIFTDTKGGGGAFEDAAKSPNNFEGEFHRYACAKNVHFSSAIREKNLRRMSKNRSRTCRCEEPQEESRIV